jgi:hypothetical protein
MSHEEADALTEFIKDHDKRFEAKARMEGGDSSVLLTLVSDGVPLAPIVSIEQYRSEQIEANDPGPTVRTAWEAWSARHE